MRFPTLRYGSYEELLAHARHFGDEESLARFLRRDLRTVHDWLAGNHRVPWWVPELLRLRIFEGLQVRRQMSYKIPNGHRPLLEIVDDKTTNVLELQARRPAIRALRAQAWVREGSEAA